jgi:Ca-activated chloride channel family protein
MKLLPDDPKLTAYALGELNPAERAEIEAALKDSPECRQVVEEIRQLCGTLSKELKAEPCPVLDEEQRAAVMDAGAKVLPGPEPENVIAFPRRNVFLVAAALAACLAMTAIIQHMGVSKKDEVRQMARNEKVHEIAAAPAEPVPVVLNPKPREIVEQTNGQALVGGSLGNETPGSAPNVANFSYIVDGASPPVAPPPQRVPAPTVSSGPVETEAKIKAGSVASNGRVDSFGINDPAMAKNAITVDRLTEGKGLAESERLVAASAEAVKLKLELEAGRNLNRLGWISPSPQASAAPQSNFADRLRSTSGNNIHPAETPLADGTVALTDGHLSLATAEKRYTVLDVQGGNDFVFAEGSTKKKEIADQEAQVKQLAQTYKPTHPKYQEAERKLAELKEGEKYYFRAQPKPETTTTASYPRYYENPFVPVVQQPLSTFSIDVDTASYANVRRFLNSNRLPPPDAVRIEELVNYFSYNYPQPKGNDPFSVNIESASCPWNGEHRLLRVALKGREIANEKRPASNFVFLIDVSGSMQPQERLPLIKQGLRMLVKKMNAGDRVAIVVYASSSGQVLASTSCEQKEKILEAIDRLEAGGSTNGGEGIQRAYDVASENFIKGGVNRVILCTDGDFNVGITSQDQLIKLIQDKAKSGVYLTTLGVGTDNLKDALMQKLADKGNGNYHYLDSVEEAHKVLVEQMNGTLVTIAKDVKIQIEFNPSQVQSYRLIGYEKRMLKTKDFNDDTKDAGEIGAGHTVTALYEVVPAGTEIRPVVNDLKYQPTAAPKPERVVNTGSKEMLTIKLRYKQPDGDTSKLLEFPYTDEKNTYRRASGDFKFATAVTTFGLILRNSDYKGSSNLDAVLELAEEAKGADVQGYRAEFINLVKKAKALKR